MIGPSVSLDTAQPGVPLRAPYRGSIVWDGSRGRVADMMSRRRDHPNWAPPPTVGQIKTGFWLSTVGAVGFWLLYAPILADRGFSQSILALFLPILTTYGAVSLYVRHKSSFR